MAQTSNSTLPLSDADLDFLADYLPQHDCTPAAPVPTNNDRPHVTLTYACSLDGMISLAPGLRTTLSGPETKSMTHYLRQKHDAILVGVGTAIADSPSLNCRYPGAGLGDQPRPIIVDPHGRWKAEGTPVVQLAEAGKALAPWIYSIASIDRPGDEGLVKSGGMRLKYGSPHRVPDVVNADTKVPDPSTWPDILKRMGEQGIRSVMIEGGATVIATLLAQPHLVDVVIVTIAPTWLGQGGVAACPPAVLGEKGRDNAATMWQTAWRQFGADGVACGRLRKAA